MRKQKFSKMCFDELKQFIRTNPSLEKDQFLEMVDTVHFDYYLKNPKFKEEIINRIQEIQTKCQHGPIMQEFSVNFLYFWNSFIKIQKTCLSCGKRI